MVYMSLLTLALYVSLLPHAFALNPNYFYSDHGYYSNSCPSQPCPTCLTGQFRSGCGNTGSSDTSTYASQGTCQPCTQKPANSVYAAYPTGGTFRDVDCPWTCATNYVKSGASCVLGTCPALTDSTKEYIDVTVSCNTRCKAGYRGDLAVNPTTCTACSIGTFSATAGSTACTACSAGYSNGAQAQTSCLPCSTGSYSAASASTCTLCQAGKFAGVSASATCDNCAAGTYTPTTGYSVCTSCDAGSAAGSTGATTCTACNPGTIAATKGLSTCSPCQPNGLTPTYMLSSGGTTCIDCSVCPTNGQFRSGCGGASVGSCVACSV